MATKKLITQTRKRRVSNNTGVSAAHPVSQPPTPQEIKEAHLYDDIKNILVDLNSRMEDSNEVYELLDQLDKVKQNAKVKQYELEMLETLAWTSSETAVVEARKSLFTATKLSHFQFIAEAVEAWKEDNFMFDDDYGDACGTVDECEEDYVTRHDWINGFSNFIHTLRNRGYRKKNTRDQIKQYIQGM